MKSEKIPYLCGGTLFTLIIQARKLRAQARARLNGGSDGLKDTDVMEGLIFAVTGEHPMSSSGDSFKTITNNFKTCKSYGRTYIPFNNTITINSFNSAYEQKNPDLVSRMSEFVEKFLRGLRTEWLVKALIEVIQDDEEIHNDTTFQITSDVTLKKEEFSRISLVELPIFLLSIMNYILNERKDNTLGRSTFEAWHIHEVNKSYWEFNSDVGNAIKQRIVVDNKCGLGNTDVNKCSSSCADTSREEIYCEDSMTIPFVTDDSDLNKPQYSNEDKELLQEFTEDYDDIMITLMGDNYSELLIDMTLPEKIIALYDTKWKSRADSFSNPLLKSLVYGLLGELNQLSKGFADGYCYPGSVKIIRKKVRNLYVKLHPESYSVTTPYDAFIDDWNDGELY